MANGDKESVILAATRAEVSALNKMAQESLKSEGRLGAKSAAIGTGEIFEGDRVLFTKNSMALSVMNGDRGFVRETDGKTVSVELDSGATVKVDTDAYADIQLGYALTTHKAQGMTVERSFILVSEQMVDREMTYVQASRARGETRWYVSEDLCEVTRDMAHSRRKEMALSFAGPELQLDLIP